MSNPTTSIDARSSAAENFFELVESHGSAVAMAMLWLVPIIALVLALTSG
jgi:hypothetical protein